jgi:hypothetical protein
MTTHIFKILPLLAGLLLVGCAGPEPYVYRHVPGKTAILNGTYAIAPPDAPDAVHAAIAAGNRIAGLPYAWGGGHRHSIDAGYDCSGSASYLLQAAGRLNGAIPSKSFRHYGESGPGKWISIYARRDHVFLVVAGLRFDTGWGHGPRGPQWTTKSRPTNGAVVRHPAGL